MSYKHHCIPWMLYTKSCEWFYQAAHGSFQLQCILPLQSLILTYKQTHKTCNILCITDKIVQHVYCKFCSALYHHAEAPNLVYKNIKLSAVKATIKACFSSSCYQMQTEYMSQLYWYCHSYIDQPRIFVSWMLGIRQLSHYTAQGQRNEWLMNL